MAPHVAKYSVNKRAVDRAKRLIEGRQYVLDSDWGEAQPNANDENAFLKSHAWAEYGEWHLGLTEGPSEETKARYAFVYGDFRRLHRSGLIKGRLKVAEGRGRYRRAPSSSQAGRSGLPRSPAFLGLFRSSDEARMAA